MMAEFTISTTQAFLRSKDKITALKELLSRLKN